MPKKDKGKEKVRDSDDDIPKEDKGKEKVRDSDDDEPKRDGEVRILSVNTCGFDSPKWKKLKAMADSHNIDVIVIQEGAEAKKVQEIIKNDDWEPIVSQERPAARGIKRKIGDREREEKVAASVGRNLFYITLKRRKTANLQLQEREYKPADCETVKKFVFGDSPEQSAPTEGPSGQPIKRSTRIRIPPVLPGSNIVCLGERGPQFMKGTVPGHRSFNIFNFHAPQGSGSGGVQGQSGMDADKGHEILTRFVKERKAPSIVVGDQNVNGQAMRGFYPGMVVLSAGASEHLTHAAISRGLSPEQIDLGKEGKDFKNKGTPGCSDHGPLAFKFFPPKNT
jgi:hypothetical protein